MSNSSFWKISDVGADPSIDVGVTDMMNAYHTSVAANLTSDWSLVCALYENLTTPEGKATIFSTLPGSGGSDNSHPQSQVVRINEYAFEGPSPGKQHRGSWSQSGCIESLSTRGRLNDITAFSALKNFITTQQIMSGPNWTLHPQLREQLTPPPGATYAFHPMSYGQPSARLFKLLSRTTSLCATA